MSASGEREAGGGLAGDPAEASGLTGEPAEASGLTGEPAEASGLTGGPAEPAGGARADEPTDGVAGPAGPRERRFARAGARETGGVANPGGGVANPGATGSAERSRAGAGGAERSSTAADDTERAGGEQPDAARLAAAMLAGAPGGRSQLAALLATALDALDSGASVRRGPLLAGGPEAARAVVTAALADGTVAAIDGGASLADRILPRDGVGAEAALGGLAHALAAGAVEAADPSSAGHLHCPPLAVAVAADLVVSALNPSLDSWDQGPAAIEVEQAVVGALARLAGYDAARASGTITTGGTESNAMGLLLAREHARGGPPRIYCSRLAHFSVQRAAELLGLGEDAVVPVAVDERRRLDPAALAQAIDDRPAVIVATAGTTEFGSIDPLPELAELARTHGAWLHVDAAYGGGALFSAALAPLLDGLAAADSLALDLHKLGWQPAPAGAFLVRERASLAPLGRRAAYLNPADDEAAGYTSLLGSSLRTTRRPDAFKMAVTLRALGRAGLGALVDRCHALTRHAAAAIDAHPRLELDAEPTLATVVFRYRAADDPDRVNAELRRRLLHDGRAVIGRSELPTDPPQTWLRLTLMNPSATERDLDALLAAVAEAGAAVEKDGGGVDTAASPAGGQTAPTPDPLLDPDPQRVAQAAAGEALLRCWVREAGVPVPGDGETLRLELPASGVALDVPVRYRSACGWHRFGRPRIAGGADADPLDSATLAALVAREAARRQRLPAHTASALAARVLDSERRVAVHVAARRAEPADPPSATPFIAAEQALLLGHPFHPVPKSRAGASDVELAQLSPELRGSFALHWFAADRALVASDSALAASAPALLEPFGNELDDLPRGALPVPVHPWQAHDLLSRPAVADLIDQGRLRPLGASGPRWHPTSSLRTVYRSDAALMLKLSLGLRITNSRRENRRDELQLGVQMRRLLDAGLGAALQRAHPRFGLVDDPAWIALEVPGFETALRENPFGPTARVACIAGLVAERPESGRSRLAELIRRLAGDGAASTGEVAAEWLDRYLRLVAEPVLWLLSEHGVGLEAHQQNTLVALDADGWPAGGWYRDNQGYYLTESGIERLRALLPGVGAGVDAVFADALVQERIGYYLGINNLLGLIGALGAERLADERALLARLRGFLQRLAPASSLAAHLLDAPTLRCKANLLTSADGRDELEGSVEAQSIYAPLPNPIA